MRNLLFGKRLIILVGVLLTVAAAPVGILALNQYMGAEATTETVDYAKLKNLIDPNRGKDPVKLNGNDKLTIPTDAKSGVAYQLESLHIDAATGAATTVSEGVIRLYPPATNAHDNKAVLGNNDMAIYRGTDYDLALNATDDGFASYIVILNEDAPTSYDFSFDMPSGYKLREDGDGGIEALNDDGDVVGIITAPWAVDADGDAVRTTYKLSESAIVQTIQHSGAAYPVVADPETSWNWTHITRKYFLGYSSDWHDEIDEAEDYVRDWPVVLCAGSGIAAFLGVGLPGYILAAFVCAHAQTTSHDALDALEEIEDDELEDPIALDCQVHIQIATYGGHFRRVKLVACGVNYSESISF